MQSADNINNSYFEGLYKHAWKRTIPQGLTEAEVDFIIDTASLNKSGSVLDIMCGYGRHALELGKRGIPVTALDNLSDYIDEITEITGQQQFPVKPIQADLLHAQFDGLFDVAICMGNSFAFFNREDASQILKNLSRHIKNGGKLIINSWMIAEIAIRYFRERDWHWAGEFKCVLEYQYFSYPSRIESEQTIIAPDGTVEIVKGVDYIFTLDDLEAMFQAAGLKTTHLYSTPRKKKFMMGDQRIYIVAEKI
jgi:SAM-dependent methyltransferase